MIRKHKKDSHHFSKMLSEMHVKFRSLEAKRGKIYLFSTNGGKILISYHGWPILILYRLRGGGVDQIRSQELGLGEETSG